MEKNILEVGYQLNAVYDKPAHNQLVRHFLQNRLAAGQETIRVEHYDEIRQVLDQLGIVASTDIQRYFMFRITNFRSLLVKLVPLLEKRLHASDLTDWKGQIRLQHELDAQTLNISGGKITVDAETDAPTIALKLSQLQVLQLIFGELDASSVLIEYPVLSILFPPDQLLYWPTDNF